MVKSSDINNLPRSVIAAAFKMSAPNVNSWVKKGCPRNPDGGYDLAAVIQWRLEELEMQGCGAPEDPEARKWLTSFRRERAKKARIERLALSREFVRTDEIQKVAFECGRQVKDGCLAIADRCASLVAVASDADECKQILNREIRIILENLANSLAVLGEGEDREKTIQPA